MLRSSARPSPSATAWGSDDTYGGVFGLLSTLTDTMEAIIEAGLDELRLHEAAERAGRCP